jgi:RHS repeat-associated protein
LAGNLQALQYGNGVTNRYQYDSLNRLTNLVWNLNVSTLANFSYQLGAAGTRTNLNETVGGTNRVYVWQYDQLYRLTNENESSLMSPSGNLAYQYDPVGNRLARQSTISQLPTTSYSYGTNDWLSTDKYDANGNTTNSAGTNFQYDVMNHITNATINGSQVVMTYDGDGNRVSKTMAGVTVYYLVDGVNPSGYAQVLEEYRGTTLTNVYNYGLGLISQRTPSISTNYFISDGHGSTRMLTDIGGTVVNVMVYDAYGNLIASNGALQTAYLYSGQQFDSDLELYYNRARYLNTGTGRFWTADSTEGDNEEPLSLHRYLYAEDDPVNKVDPSGNDILSAQIGTAVHQYIGRDFVNKLNPYGISGPSVATILGKFGIPVNTITALFPDLVDINPKHKEIYEIKPAGLANLALGEAQLQGYIQLFNYFDRKKGWHAGTGDDYTPPISFELISPVPTLVYAEPSFLGVIQYETLQDLVKSDTKDVEEGDEGELEDEEGIDTDLEVMEE